MTIYYRGLSLSAHLLKLCLVLRKQFNQIAVIILLFSASSAAFSLPPYCDTIFFNGLITHSDGGRIKFGSNAQLLDAPFRFLMAANVTSDYDSEKWSCDYLFCAPYSTPVIEPLLIPPKGIFSKHDLIIHANKNKTLNGKKTGYGRVYVGPHATLSFSRAATGYTIDELNLYHKSTLKVAPGEYWINNLNLDEGGKIEVIGEGTAMFYVLNDVSIPTKFKINDKTREPAKLGIYSYKNLSFAKGSKTYAFIYSLGDIKLAERTKIVGGLIGKNIDLEPKSSVRFAQSSLQYLNFGTSCSGGPPTRDFTPPVIELDPFPYNTPASSITLSGKVTDPDNGIRWISSATLAVNYGEPKLLELDDEGRFSLVLPLTGTHNSFSIFAIDKSYNRTTINFTVRRESTLEFAINMDPYEFEQIRPMPISGVITTPEGTVIENAFIKTAQGNIALELVNNRFSLSLPIVRGVNEYLAVARDQHGNEISTQIYINGSSTPVVGQLRPLGKDDGPIRYYTGFIYSLWPLEDLSLSINNIPHELRQVSEGIYEFNTENLLHDGRNRLNFIITTPDGETYQEFDDFYSPDRIFLTVNEPLDPVEIEADTVTISGTLHIPYELIAKYITLVVTSDRFPGIEYLVETPTLNTTGNTEFSVEVPLAPGQNNLLVKVKQGSVDADPGPGVSQNPIRVFRN